MSTNLNMTRKFLKNLGEAKDFVDFLYRVESTEQFHQLGNFSEFMTPKGARYLLVKKGSTPVIDFRHFFAAMSQRLYGSIYNGSQFFRESGMVLMLGIGNEISQCIDEALKAKLNSCFSSEDLASNRLGVEFADILLIKKSENSKRKMSEHLHVFLHDLRPLSPKEVSDLKSAGRGSNLTEIIRQVFTAIMEGVFPRAY